MKLSYHGLFVLSKFAKLRSDVSGYSIRTLRGEPGLQRYSDSCYANAHVLQGRRLTDSF